jgi:hypothetical protein
LVFELKRNPVGAGEGIENSHDCPFAEKKKKGGEIEIQPLHCDRLLILPAHTLFTIPSPSLCLKAENL